MTATLEASSAPGTRLGSPAPMQRFSTPPPPPSSAVPTDFRSSLSAWWNNTSYKEARIAEERLLRRMAHYRPPPPPAEKGWFGRKHEQEAVEVVEPLGTEHGLVATLRNVFIPTPDPSKAPAHPADPAGASPAPSIASTSSTDSKKKHKEKALVDYINTLEISKSGDDSKQGVVVLHGYAAALGFFFRNWESIADQTASTGKRTFFLDWLGMGLSSRPSASLMSGSTTSSDPAVAVPQRVSRAEHFFVSSLEAWRQAVGLGKMVLVGHSLGGYLASAYAVRYPSRVAGLVLVSPAGIPHGPEYTKYHSTAERATLGMNAGDQSSPSLEPAADAAAKEMGDEGKFEPKGEAKNWKNNREQSMFRRNATKFFVWGWERGISPFSFLRGMGPFGPMFAGKYSLRRFGSQSEEDVRDIHAYIYNTSMLKGSGEYCISHILAPGAYARIPIVDRIDALKVPITFIYGDNDWMDLDGGKASVRALEKAGNNDASVHVVAKAGHHVYLDNPDDTNKIIGDAIRAVKW